jgi:hypothetical protein
MTNGSAKTFPARFLNAITPGADLSRVGWQFLHWLLSEELASRDDPRVATEIKACADVLVPLTKGQPCDRNAADLARRVARNKASELWSAYADAAADDDAAAAAAYAAAYAADSAADAAARRANVRLACYQRMAEKLLQLMADAPLHGYFMRAAA